MLIPAEMPAAGHRACTPILHGSADALAISRLARAHGRPLAVITATAADAQRLLDELPFFDPEIRVHLFPDWETLPYDQLSPHHDLVSERLATLYQLMQRSLDVAIVPVTTALYRLAPVEYLAARSFHFRQGARLAEAELRSQLVTAGYAHVTQVVAPGEYCVRGGLIDIFPMGSALPYRIELDDDIVESIRSFDADTQRSIYKVNEVRLLPAREFPLDEAAQGRFRQSFRERFEGDPSRARVYKDISKGVPSAGIEYYLPLFFEKTARLTDYLPPETVLVTQGALMPAVERFWSDTFTRYSMLRGDSANPPLPPHDLFLTTDEFFGAIKPFSRIEIPDTGEAGTGDEGSAAEAVNEAPVSRLPSPVAPLPPLAVERRAENPLHRLRAFLDTFPGRVLLLAEGMGRRETLHEYLT